MIMKRLLSAAYSVYLFSKSDLILVICPTMMNAIVLVGPTDWSSFFVALLWLELHLLAFNIKNQMIGIEEDRLCKPYRPFASGRIPLEHGQSLYLLFIALSAAISLLNELLPVSLAYMIAITLYNEGGWVKGPIAKNAFGAFGYVCYCWGTTYIIGHHQPLTNTSITAVIYSGLIFTTTGHAQDFKDRSGDATLGRKTLPLVMPPATARWTLVALILAWTYGLVVRWQPSLVACIVLAVLGITFGVKSGLNWDHLEEVDRRSFRWYELWLLCAYTLPVFERVANGEISSPLQTVLPRLSII